MSYDAEKWMVGSILIDPDIIAQVDLMPPHFENERFAAVWAKALSRYQEGLPFVWADADHLFSEEEGWSTELTQAVNMVMDYRQYPTYASMVMDSYEMRVTSSKLDLMAKYLHDGDMEKVRNVAQDVATSKVNQDTIVVAKGGIAEAIENLREMSINRSVVGDIYRWPWPELANKLGSPEAGMMVCFGAADGTGKTVFAEGLAEGWAEMGVRTGLYHLELNPEIMMRRRIARLSGVSEAKIKFWDLTPEEEELVNSVAQKVESWPGDAVLIHSPGWTIEEITRDAEIRGLDAVAIDYVNKLGYTGQLRPSDEFAIQAHQLEFFKNWAERRSKVAVFLTQLRKDAKGRRPTKSDVYGAGAVTDKSNQVILAWREEAQATETITVKDPATGERVQVTLADLGKQSSMMRITVEKNTMGKMPDDIEMRLFGPRFMLVGPESKRVPFYGDTAYGLDHP